MNSKNECAAMFLLCGFVLIEPHAAEVIKGRVVDGGKQVRPGIPAVRVKILDDNGKKLEQGLTDADGHYELEVSGSPRTLHLDKVNYVNRNATRPLNLHSPTQADAILCEENQAPAYYENVARAFNESGKKEALQYAEIVAALPTKQQALVREKLTSESAISALAAVKSGEQGMLKQYNMQKFEKEKNDRKELELKDMLKDYNKSKIYQQPLQGQGNGNITFPAQNASPAVRPSMTDRRLNSVQQR